MDKKQFDRRKFITHLGISAGAGLLGSAFSKSVPVITDCKITPIQEAGPFAVMQYRHQPDHDIDLTIIKGQRGIASGDIISVKGKVTDKNCNPLAAAIVEIWQANHFGRYKHEYEKPGQEDKFFQGWGQAITNIKGEYSFKTVIPGLYGNRARHIHFKISKRGFHEVVTQLYFSGLEGEERNKTDGILNQLTHEEQQLVIQPLVEKNGLKEVIFNITLDKVDATKLPEKVLKEYVGEYELKDGTFNIKQAAKNLSGKDYDKIILKLINIGPQLYMQLPFAPRIETGWHGKDEFQSWAFFNTWIRFQRNEKGKITSLRLHSGEDMYAEGIKLK